MRWIFSLPFILLMVIVLMPFWVTADASAGSAGDFLGLRLGDSVQTVETKLGLLTNQGIISMASQPNTFSHDLLGSLVNVSLSFDGDELGEILIKSATSYPISHCDSPWQVDVQRYLGAMEKQFGPLTRDFHYPSISEAEAIMGSVTLAGKWLLAGREVLVGVDDTKGELTPLIRIAATD